MSIKHRALPVIAVCLGFSSTGYAQQKYEHRTCYTGPHHVIMHSKESMGGVYNLTGMVIADAGDPLYMASGVCMGSWTLAGGQYDDGGSCEYTLPSGDKIFGVYSRKNQDNGVWKVVSATGKVQGLVHSGNWMPFTQFPQPSGQLTMCGREWGTWKLGQN
jgi:hypothetical protein